MNYTLQSDMFGICSELVVQCPAKHIEKVQEACASHCSIIDVTQHSRARETLEKMNTWPI